MKIFNLTPLTILCAIFVGLVLSAAIVAIVSSSTNYTKPEVKPEPTIQYTSISPWNATVYNINETVYTAFNMLAILMVLIGVTVIAMFFLSNGNYDDNGRLRK